MSNIIEELKWRGLLQDIMPGTEELLMKEKITVYAGFDPTSDSLTIGNMVPIMLLMHLQRAGHKPLALVGGATGMVGDPSGKSTERSLMSIEQIEFNLKGIQKQLEKFLDFKASENAAEIVNNFDWFKTFSFLDFIRDAGKHITVSYMMSKDSVKSRLEGGMSFTEFSYQLIQGYDFYHLYNIKNCRLQVGGSDQWGNITTGTELIRRKAGGEGYAFTAPLITKSDGTKFGKSEGNNVWLDAAKTSPYKFYQFWLNNSDEDAKKFIKIFTFLTKEEIEKLTQEHDAAPHLRILQKELATQFTTRIHGKEALDLAIQTSEILFGKSTKEALLTLNNEQIEEVFEGVPQFTIAKSELSSSLSMIDFLSEKTGIFASKGEAKRSLQENAISINLEKVKMDSFASADLLINDAIILVKKGKNNYYLVKVK
ncbi:MAG: tyrosine--tRNA ligase [Bacteroidota bacterium]